MNNRIERTLAIPMSAILVLLALAGGCGRPKAARETRAPLAVRVDTVQMRSIPRSIEAVGSLQCAREAVLSGKVMGTVTDIRKSAGEAVKRGEILLVIDSRDVAGQIAQAKGALAQAQAAVALAEANFRRFDGLSRRGSASQLECDQARYQYETAKGAVVQAEGAVATAESYRAYADIPAPFDGRVVDRLCEIGDMAAPGRPLIKVEDPSSIRLHVTVPEGEAGAVHPGATARVEVPSLQGRTLEGRIAEVVPASDRATHSILVKIDLPMDAALRSGLYARARFEVESRPTIRVARASVIHRGGMAGVFVAEGEHATFRIVETGDSTEGDSLDVLSGLREGDRILISPSADLEEGTPIEVRP